MISAADRGDGSPRLWWAVLLPLWIASLGYVWRSLDSGWIPHDEGTLAQAAERLVAGEWPHRDFDDVYTGGLARLNGFAFRWFGTRLFSMRIPLFALFALWVPALYWIATRFASPLLAAPFVALGVTWSLPMYGAPMPSWYLLFFATFGTAALLRHLDGGRLRWLFAAGLCGGTACLAKITGLHFVAAALLFGAWREPALTSPLAREGARPRGLYRIVVGALLVVLVLGLAAQVWKTAVRWGSAAEFEHFVLPGALLAALVLRRAWIGSAAPDRARFAALFRSAGVLLLGVMVPIAAFSWPYAASGSIGALIDGVLVAPTKRLTAASAPPPEIWTIVFTAGLLLPLLLPGRGGRAPKIGILVASGVLLAGVVVSFFEAPVYWGVNLATRHLIPVLVGFGAWRAWKCGADVPPRMERTVLLLIATAFVSLVQFPFSVPIYWFYAAPLLAVASLGVLPIDAEGTRTRPGVLVLVGFLLVFTLACFNGTFIDQLGVQWAPTAHTTPMGLDKGGLRVWSGDAEEYGRVVELVREHARGGFVWAGPDAPEVPFLAGLRNPTRMIFDFFDRDFSADPPVRAARLLRALDDHGVTAIAVNRWPGFSGPLPDDLMGQLRARYPASEDVGRFTIRWKE